MSKGRRKKKSEREGCGTSDLADDRKKEKKRIQGFPPMIILRIVRKDVCGLLEPPQGKGGGKKGRWGANYGGSGEEKVEQTSQSNHGKKRKAASSFDPLKKKGGYADQKARGKKESSHI